MTGRCSIQNGNARNPTSPCTMLSENTNTINVFVFLIGQINHFTIAAIAASKGCDVYFHATQNLVTTPPNAVVYLNQCVIYRGFR